MIIALNIIVVKKKVFNIVIKIRIRNFEVRKNLQIVERKVFV